MLFTLGSMGRNRGTGLTEKQAQHLAEELRAYLSRYDNNQTAMAKAWGISQPQLSQIIAGSGRGAGVAVLCRLRMHTGKSIDDLLGLPPLGATLEDQIRAAVDKAFAERKEPSEPPPLSPRPRLPPPRPRGTHR